MLAARATAAALTRTPAPCTARHVRLATPSAANAMSFCAACVALEARAPGAAVAAALALALLLRLAVATQPHSGQATPPKFGDYEARG